jgi:hypothetical protein
MFTFGRNPFEGINPKDLLTYIMEEKESYMKKPALCPDELYVP